KACPLLVPLAEEGWTHNSIAKQTIDIYLEPFRSNGVEALILGCTHYPLFKDSILEYFDGKPIEIIDSAEAVAEMAQGKLSELELLNDSGKKGELTCYVSDRPQRFRELAERFIGREIDIKTAD
ncbi:MAG: glutamate racemase, partial [Bacteroidetes bacterium]|nr:glutamate racemase [Bacteroidota bacterium]